MKDNQYENSTVQSVSLPKSSDGVGVVLVALLSCALSLAALVVSIANLYTLLRLIRLIAPILTPAS